MAPETALPIPDLFAGLDPKPAQQFWRHAIVVALAAIFGPIRIGPRRVANSLQLDNPSLEVGIVHFSETILNRLIQPSQFGFRVRSLLPQLGNSTLQRSARSSLRLSRPASSSSSRSGARSRSSRCDTTIVSNSSIGIVRPRHAVFPCRAVVQHV